MESYDHPSAVALLLAGLEDYHLHPDDWVVQVHSVAATGNPSYGECGEERHGWHGHDALTYIR